MNELQFESELIQYLCSGTISNPADTTTPAWGTVKEKPVDYVVKSKLWKYEPGIKTTDQLWDNFKAILEQHNQDTLEHPLSVVGSQSSEANHFRFRNSIQSWPVFVRA